MLFNFKEKKKKFHILYHFLKVLSQWLHTYGVSPVCCHTWVFKPGIKRENFATIVAVIKLSPNVCFYNT